MRCRGSSLLVRDLAEGNWEERQIVDEDSQGISDQCSIEEKRTQGRGGTLPVATSDGEQRRGSCGCVMTRPRASIFTI
jgi:hypothetical protein